MKLEIIQPQYQIKLTSVGVQGPKGDTGDVGPRGFDTGTSGTSGINGTAGSGGTSGINGTAGSGGTSGINGTAGSGGTSGTRGSAGTSGTSGINGTNGSNGTSGFTQDVSYFATTGSNIFSGSQFISGSLVPSTGNGTYTSSFSLGSPTNAWKDLWISQGSIIFVDAITQQTSSFTITANQEVQYSSGITASYYEGDGSRLYNLPSNTNWNKDKAYILRKTEQLTFSGDYILENCALMIEGSISNSIGEWTNVNPDGNDGTITKTGNNTYRIDGPNDDTGSGQVYIKKFFNTPITMSIGYEWSNLDTNEDWPIYEVTQTEPTGAINNTTKLENNNNSYETGSWTINVPANNWLAIGVYSTDSCCGSGSLNLTLPYIINEDSVQYAPNKYFKKEGSLFIGGNLLLKDSYIVNDGKISVGGEVILIGDSHIEGTGIII